MKFYNRYPGDIMKKTSGLTMAQFGAYDRLIDWCYANEKPIDPEEVYIITHAQTPADRRDVDRVLAKFFERDAEGFRQQRIEEETIAAHKRIEAAQNNGAKGGRPKKNPKQTREKPTGFSTETQDEPAAKAIQPSNTSGDKSPSAASEIAAELVAAEVYGSIAGALRRAGVSDAGPSSQSFRALIDAGATAEEFLAFVPKSLGKGSPFAYLVSCVERERIKAAETAGKLHQGAMPRALSAAEQRALEAVPGIASAQLRTPPTLAEVIDVSPLRLG